jgi:hypothetical protein
LIHFFLRTAKYRIRISEESLRLLKDFGRSCKNLTDVMKEKILFESKKNKKTSYFDIAIHLYPLF